MSLPQNKEAFILAFCERDEMISFALHPFITQKSNIIELNTVEISKEEMQLKLKALNFEGLSTSVDKTQNTDEVKKITINLENIESLKPKGADCNCFKSEMPFDSGFNHDFAGGN